MVNEKEYQRAKKIEQLMFDTMVQAKKLNCSIKVNAKTGKLSWEKY